VPLVRLFAPDGSGALLSFTPWALRVGTLLVPLAGFQVVSANFFAVTGRPKVSSFLALTRQFIFLLPALLVLGRLFGLHGVVSAMPVADGLSLAVTAVMIARELKVLGK
jgi:Na+-driven multidrug efflux pump